MRPSPASLTSYLALLALSAALAACDVSGDGHEQYDVAYAPDGGVDVREEDTWEMVCEPGTIVCEDLRRKVCAANGAGWSYSDCPPGSGCVADGVCERAHPRIVFIFDTSSSMLATPGTVGVPVNPTCGSVEAEGSRIDLSKGLFRTLFAEPIATAPRMALMRFPQRAAADESCDAARYLGASRLRGDDGSHEAPVERGSWFRSGLGEVLVSPLPFSLEEDGRDSIVEWLDGEELVLPANKTCVSDGECSEGFCSGGQCYRYLAPELRASGSTPLGRTMFYAGEYYRAAVYIDGRECTSDAECTSPGYRCGEDGRCWDPLESCRDDHVIVFSDGAETAASGPQDYYHPLNQARRMRFGLVCEVDRDCLGGGVCGAAGTCEPPGEAPAAVVERDELASELESALMFTDPEGVQRLHRQDGRPVSLQVHVLDVWGDPRNEGLAWAGGGEYVTGSFEDPEAVLHQMNLLFQSKGSDAICAPIHR